MIALLDTNVILRDVDALDSQHALVRAAIEERIRADWDLLLAPQILYEFWVVATRPPEQNGLGLSPSEANARIRLLRDAYSLLPDPPDLLARWLELCVRTGVRGKAAHDARLVAWMHGHAVTHLVTFNPTDFQRYPGVSLVVPGQV